MSNKKNVDDRVSLQEFDLDFQYDRFPDVLEAMQGEIDEKVRSLWLEVYKNIVNDRATARMLLVQMVIELKTRQANSQIPEVVHLESSPLLVKYMERVAKCNDQLLDLLKMVENYVGDSGALTDDDIFESIEADD